MRAIICTATLLLSVGAALASGGIWCTAEDAAAGHREVFFAGLLDTLAFVVKRVFGGLTVFGGDFGGVFHCPLLERDLLGEAVHFGLYRIGAVSMFQLVFQIV